MFEYSASNIRACLVKPEPGSLDICSNPNRAIEGQIFEMPFTGLNENTMIWFDQTVMMRRLICQIWEASFAQTSLNGLNRREKDKYTPQVLRNPKYTLKPYKEQHHQF